MFDFLRRSRRPESATTICQALVDDRLSVGIDPHTLSVLQRRGSYSGRPVSYFRVFDPAAAATTGVQLRKFEDLDVHSELILGTGHVERSGAVVLTPRATTHTRPAPARLLANRRAHDDDERIVFPNEAL
jgi:hypothetical protein